MSEVSISVELPADMLQALISAADEAGMSPEDLAAAVVKNYLEENYG